MFNNAFSSHLTDSVQRMLNKKLAKELGVESGTIMDATYPVALTKYNIGMGGCDQADKFVANSHLLDTPSMIWWHTHLQGIMGILLSNSYYL